jgi:hypothetical protein
MNGKMRATLAQKNRGVPRQSASMKVQYTTKSHSTTKNTTTR